MEHVSPHHTTLSSGTPGPSIGESVSVIVCAYTEKRWDDLCAAVESLRVQSYAPSEIILVIDHNQALFEHAQAEIASKWPVDSYIGFQVIQNGEEQGLSGARNSGIAVASGSVLAFMDEDAVAEPDWLASLVPHYQDNRVLGVGGAIVPNWHAQRPAWFPEEFDWVVGCTYRGMPESASPVRNLIGCNMSFRRSVAAQNGGFRSGIGRVGTLPVGCEETEYCIRARALWPKGEFLYEPTARVLHNVPAARATWNYFRSRCYHEGRSKAAVTQMSSMSKGLSAESVYTVRTLPLGVLRGMLNAVQTRKTAGLRRASAIVAGLLITTWGYLRMRITMQQQGSPSAEPAAARHLASS